MDNRPYDNRALWLVLPVFLLVAFNALIPFMTVINYSVQDTFGPHTHVFVGTEWFKSILQSHTLQHSLIRQFIYSGLVLLIEIPLGILVALSMPTGGKTVGLVLVLLTLPMLIPWSVVGFIWEVFARSDIGAWGAFVNWLGFDYHYSQGSVAAWVTVMIMEVWHWTSLVALLSYAGLRAIPSAYYQAAMIDGASRFSIFRYIELPRLRGVLMIAVLLRFMDSFMVYAEPFTLTGGGPGNTTTYLSQSLVTMAVGSFDLGRGGAFSLIYFLIILLLSYVFYQIIFRIGKTTKSEVEL